MSSRLRRISLAYYSFYFDIYYLYVYSICFVDDLLDVRGQRRLHVVMVVMDVVVLQEGLQSSVLRIPSLLGACHFGV